VRRALAFLTPFVRGGPPDAATFDWFPVAGAAIGLALGAVWWLADRAWYPAVAAAVVVAADLALTGMLHLDGLVDSADGLLPHLPRARRLEVMADPGAGAFGVGTAAVVLLLRWSSIAAMRPRPLLLAGLWCASRTAMVVIARGLPYARDDGLASAFLGSLPVGWGVAGGVVACALAIAGRGAVGAVAVAAAFVAAGGVAELAHRRIGGFTGDVLGAAGMTAETVGLLVAAARW